jgi:hypothetical protein
MKKIIWYGTAVHSQKSCIWIQRLFMDLVFSPVFFFYLRHKDVGVNEPVNTVPAGIGGTIIMQLLMVNPE